MIQLITVIRTLRDVYIIEKVGPMARTYRLGAPWPVPDAEDGTLSPRYTTYMVARRSTHGRGKKSG